jgi:DNA mismatch repair ATPase MutS
MKTEILQKYQGLSDQYQSLSDSKKNQLKLISVARLISFIGIIPAWYYLNPINEILAFSISITFLITFFFLIKKYIQTEKQLLYYQQLVKINQNEIRAINRIGSMFQFLNRTVTSRGKKHLASLLNKSQRSVSEITSKQAAIQELAEELDWRQNFMARGAETVSQRNSNQIEDSIGQQITLKSALLLKILLMILPPLTVLLIALNITGVVEKSFYLIPVFSQWAIFLVYSKTISKFNKQFESQSKLLSQYADLLWQIESKDFKSDYLINLKANLSVKGKTASLITSELQKILNEFDYRQNILVALVLNSVFLWDVRCLTKLNNWQQNYATDLPQWFEVIAEMDALVSLANCNYNHPEWVTPEVSPSEFTFNTENLGHPLIDEKRCVSNSFQLINQDQITIITGANMAGKSTFLRTVGVNLILASNGCKVCASTFEFSPIRIYTNMRTSDNLMNDESYFYAELLRLQSMLNLLRSGENLFVIIDEMLKGTNSVDKLNGSKELIHQLISLNTHGIVATHDLGLTELAQNITSIKNQCFEVQLHNDELNFDYKLTNGVTRTMNATFLMKKMGIIPN